VTSGAAILLLLVGISDAAAQSAFVEGAFAREIRRFSHEGERSAFDATVDSVWIGAAGFVTPHVSVGVEVDLGGEFTFEETVSLTLAGRPAQITTTYTSRRRSVSALAGLHTSGDRVARVGCYVGLSFSAFRREISSDAPPVVLEEPAEPSVFEERLTSTIVGADAAIRLAPNLSVIAAVRAQGLGLSGDLNGFSIRPSIGARVTF
jgi:hypothetical protein